MSGTFSERFLEGKVAFIGGGSSGINLEIAARLAECGARVGLISRSPEKLGAAVAEIERRGGVALGVPTDVRDFDGVAAAVARVVQEFGNIDIVVSGAAGNFVAPAAEMSSNGFKTVVDIDLLGTFNVYRAAYEHLNKSGASLISITAPQSSMPYPYQAHVCAAKAGVDLLTKSLALEWGAEGIRVNAVAPGPIDETEGMARLAPTEDARRAIEAKIPLRRYGLKTDVADLSLFLCSDAATYITGAVIPCDGGLTLCGSGAMSPG